MKNLKIFEEWRDSEKLQNANRITGILDSEESIVDVDEGDTYGITDSVVSNCYIEYNNQKIYFDKVEGSLNDSSTLLECYMSDGKRIFIYGYFLAGGPVTSLTRSNEYFKIECDRVKINIDPEFALEEIITNWPHIVFVTVCYPNCTFYMNNIAQQLPKFKIIGTENLDKK